MHSPGMDASKTPDLSELGFSAPRETKKSTAKATKLALPDKAFAKAVSQALHKKSQPDHKPRLDSRQETRHEARHETGLPSSSESLPLNGKDIRRPAKLKDNSFKRPGKSEEPIVTERQLPRQTVPENESSCPKGKGIPATKWAPTPDSAHGSGTQAEGVAWEKSPGEEIAGDVLPPLAIDPNGDSPELMASVPPIMAEIPEAILPSLTLPLAEAAEFAAMSVVKPAISGYPEITTPFQQAQIVDGEPAKNADESDGPIPSDLQGDRLTRERMPHAPDPRLLPPESIRIHAKSQPIQKGWSEFGGQDLQAAKERDLSLAEKSLIEWASPAPENAVARGRGQGHASSFSNLIPGPNADSASPSHFGIMDKKASGLDDAGDIPSAFPAAPSTSTLPGMHPDALRLWHAQRPPQEELSLDIELAGQMADGEAKISEGLKAPAQQPGSPGQDGNSGMMDGHSRQGQGQMGLNHGAGFQDKWQTVIGETTSAPALASETPAMHGRNPGAMETRLHEMHALLRREIDAKAATLLQKGSEEIHMQLMPEHLGKVRIALELREGTVNAHIQVQSEAARQSVDQSLQQLRDSLGQHGFKIENLSVSVEDKHAGLFNPDGSDGRKFFRGQGNGSQDDGAGEAGQEENAETRTVRYLGYNTLEYVG